MIQSPSPTSIDPIISRLRPRSVLEILDQAFRLYRKHFLTFLAIISVTYLPVQLLVQALSVYLQGSVQETQNLTGSDIEQGLGNEFFIGLIVAVALLLVLSLVGAVLLNLSQGALTAGVTESYMDRHVSFGGSYRSMSHHVGPLLGIMLLQVLIYMAVFVPFILIFIGAFAAAIGGASGDAGVGAAFGLICFAFLLLIPTFILYFYVNVRLALPVPAIMSESLGPVQAMRRSWDLVRNYWWRTAAIVFVLGIMNSIVTAGPAYLVQALILIFTGSFDPVTVTAISGAVAVLTSLLFVPIQLIAMTLYYFDQRVRKEGFDIDTAIGQRYSPPGAPGYGQSPYNGYGSQPAYPGAQGYGSPQYQYPQPNTQIAPPALGYAEQASGESAGARLQQYVGSSQPQIEPPPQFQPYSQPQYGTYGSMEEAGQPTRAFTPQGQAYTPPTNGEGTPANTNFAAPGYVPPSSALYSPTASGETQEEAQSLDPTPGQSRLTTRRRPDHREVGGTTEGQG